MQVKIYFTPKPWSIWDWQTKTFRKGFKFWGLYLRWRIFNYFPDVDGLKGHCSSVQFTLYGHNLKRLAHSTEFSESICILWRVYGGSCVPLCHKADGTWVGPVGHIPVGNLRSMGHLAPLFDLHWFHKLFQMSHLWSFLFYKCWCCNNQRWNI